MGGFREEQEPDWGPRIILGAAAKPASLPPHASSAGRFEGEPVSVVSTHMGMPNMDFVARECRAVVKGPMAIIRLGTCGAVQRPAKLGDLLVASKGSISIRREPDYWTAGNGHQPYVCSLPVPADPQLSAILVAQAAALVGGDRVVEGLNASADSFYSSQVRAPAACACVHVRDCTYLPMS